MVGRAVNPATTTNKAVYLWLMEISILAGNSDQSSTDSQTGVSIRPFGIATMSPHHQFVSFVSGARRRPPRVPQGPQRGRLRDGGVRQELAAENNRAR